MNYNYKHDDELQLQTLSWIVIITLSWMTDYSWLYNDEL